MFGQAFGLTTTWLKGADGKFTFGKTTQSEKEKLEFYAKMYKEGLLDPEFLTKKWDTKEKAFYDGQAAIMAGTQGKVIDLYNSKSTAQNGAGAKIVPCRRQKVKHKATHRLTQVKKAVVSRFPKRPKQRYGLCRNRIHG